MKRVVSIQDISCLGKCSLTVALPILSAMNVEAAVIPTAVLSTHTAIKGYTFHDLTEDILPIIGHWQREGYTFDAVYTGYLGSRRQVDLVAEIFKRFKTPENFFLVDPVMGDNGAFYAGFNENFVALMDSLCSQADVITPNLTEASYMLRIPYIEEDGYSRDYAEDLLVQLARLGVKKPVITGIGFNQDEIGAVAYDSVADKFVSAFNERIPGKFHGTGDIFASVLTGALVNRCALADALRLSVDYSLESIKATVADPHARNYGVNFESAIPMLVKRMGNAR